jgi:hypothetical protein
MQRSIGTSIVALAATCAVALTAEGQGASCTAAGTMTKLSGVNEASGIARSARTPGAAWSHNDSGEPVVYSVSSSGAVGKSVRLTGASLVDWEDIAVGPCDDGNCLYVADIGDNNAARSSVTIYRTPEPAAGASATAKVEVLHAKYPDGAHDAEAMFVLPNGNMFIVTKGETGPSAIYRFPSAFQNGASVTLVRVATIDDGKQGKQAKEDKGDKKDKNDKKKDDAEKSGAKSAGVLAKADRITGADVSPDGRWVVLRTREYVKFYNASDFVSGNAKEVLRYDLTKLGEPQGEGVAFLKNGEVVLVGEGGGKGAPGTMIKLSCTLK